MVAEVPRADDGAPGPGRFDPVRDHAGVGIVELRAPMTVTAPEPCHHPQEAMTTGRRYGGKAAHAAGTVDAHASADALLATATDRARALASTSTPVAGEIMRALDENTLAALTRPTRSHVRERHP